MFIKLFQWLLLSSANPSKFSLSVRMALLGVVPYILSIVTAACGFGLVCLGVEAEGLNQVVGVIENLVFWGLSIIAGVGFLIGFVRKLWLSISGENKVIATWSER